MSTKALPEHDLQLLAVSCLFIASK